MTPRLPIANRPVLRSPRDLSASTLYALNAPVRDPQGRILCSRLGCTNVGAVIEAPTLGGHEVWLETDACAKHDEGLVDGIDAEGQRWSRSGRDALWGLS